MIFWWILRKELTRHTNSSIKLVPPNSKFIQKKKFKILSDGRWLNQINHFSPPLWLFHSNRQFYFTLTGMYNFIIDSFLFVSLQQNKSSTYHIAATHESS